MVLASGAHSWAWLRNPLVGLAFMFRQQRVANCALFDSRRIKTHRRQMMFLDLQDRFSGNVDFGVDHAFSCNCDIKGLLSGLSSFNTECFGQGGEFGSDDWGES